MLMTTLERTEQRSLRHTISNRRRAEARRRAAAILRDAHLDEYRDLYQEAYEALGTQVRYKWGKDGSNRRRAEARRQVFDTLRRRYPDEYHPVYAKIDEQLCRDERYDPTKIPTQVA